MFKFPTITFPVVKATNHSILEDGVTLFKRLTSGDLPYTDESDTRANQFMSEYGFGLRHAQGMS